jgi:thiamine biosynthesis protein ThiI
MSQRRTILVRYDEIGLKGKNKSYFINKLRRNINNKLSGLNNLKYSMPHGRILIEVDLADSDDCSNRLQFVPGIASISVGITMEPDFDALAKIGIEWIRPILQSASSLKFCVRTNRANKSFPHNSMECNYEIGGRIMESLSNDGLVVNINEAEFILEVEITKKEAIIFHDRVPCLRGLPVGTAGQALCLLSGGIDSPVAMANMIRRGCLTHAIFFDNQPYLGKGGYEKVIKLSKILNRYQNGGKLFIIPFEKIQEAIRDNCRPKNRVVLYRRMMYRIAAEIAEKARCLALVTGESLGQVASQTLENLNAVSQVVNLSVFRPLIAFDKIEIINIARKIETYDISIEPQPDCCSIFMPDFPATKSKVEILEDDEMQFAWQDLMSKAISDCEIIEVDNLI